MSPNGPESSWADCTPGALGQLDRRLRAKRRWLLLRDSSLLILVATLIGLTAGYFASPGFKPPPAFSPYIFAGISCDKVRAMLPELTAGRLDRAQATQIRRHVMQCPDCGPLREKMLPQKITGRAGIESNRMARVSLPVPQHEWLDL